jgi:hypothetical protein
VILQVRGSHTISHMYQLNAAPQEHWKAFVDAHGQLIPSTSAATVSMLTHLAEATGCYDLSVSGAAAKGLVSIDVQHQLFQQPFVVSLLHPRLFHGTLAALTDRLHDGVRDELSAMLYAAVSKHVDLFCNASLRLYLAETPVAAYAEALAAHFSAAQVRCTSPRRGPSVVSHVCASQCADQPTFQGALGHFLSDFHFAEYQIRATQQLQFSGGAS